MWGTVGWSLSLCMGMASRVLGMLERGLRRRVCFIPSSGNLAAHTKFRLSNLVCAAKMPDDGIACSILAGGLVKKWQP